MFFDSPTPFGLQPLCVRCHGDASRYLLCEGCWQDLPWNLIACRCCGLPLTHADQPRCRRCAQKPPPQDYACIPWRYEAPVDHWLHQLKFDRRLQLLPTLSNALIERLAARSEPLPEWILPVPLHPTRLRQRGFNQAVELARRLSQKLDRSLCIHALQRTRATPVQSRSSSAAERRRNVRGAFSLNLDLQGRDIAILDDVVTTASTVQEIARLCRKAGARRIEVWAIARTP